MIRSFKQHWQSMSHGRPGQRFQDHYAAARKSRADGSWAQRGRRALRLLAALVAVIIAVVLMFIPGPAVVFYFIAGTLLASESLFLAKLMDWGEVRLWTLWERGQGHWGRTPAWGRVAFMVLVVSLGVTSMYLGYRLMAN